MMERVKDFIYRFFIYASTAVMIAACGVATAAAIDIKYSLFQGGPVLPVMAPNITEEFPPLADVNAQPERVLQVLYPLDIPEPGDPAERERAMAEAMADATELPDGELYTVTAYCPCAECCGRWSAEHPSRQGTEYIQRTASGTVPAEGRTVGTDWSVLPAGTAIEIEGVGRRVVEDHGSYHGKVVDLFFGCHEDCITWGRRELIVKVVEE